MQLPGADADGPLGAGAGQAGRGARRRRCRRRRARSRRRRPTWPRRSTGGARLRVRYWSAARDEATERRDHPAAVFADRGNWYVHRRRPRSPAEPSARSASTGSRSVERTGEHVEPCATVAPGPRRVVRRRRTDRRAAARAGGALGGGALPGAVGHAERRRHRRGGAADHQRAVAAPACCCASGRTPRWSSRRAWRSLAATAAGRRCSAATGRSGRDRRSR